MPMENDNYWRRITGLDPGGVTTKEVLSNAAAGWRSALHGRSFTETVLRGGASAVLPISPFEEGPLDAFESVISSASKLEGEGLLKRAGRYGGELLSKIPHGTRKAVQYGGRLAMRWVGPVMTTYRLATETRGKGVLGGISQATRILGEETGMGLGFLAGGAIGGAVAGAIGGSAVPGLGTVIGAVVGLAIGSAIGSGWNTAVDIAEAPFRFAGHLRAIGKRSNSLELGGQASAANRTRAAATMRQRHLMAMSRSGMNERSLLGREASMVHIRSLT